MERKLFEVKIYGATDWIVAHNSEEVIKFLQTDPDYTLPIGSDGLKLDEEDSAISITELKGSDVLKINYDTIEEDEHFLEVVFTRVSHILDTSLAKEYPCPFVMLSTEF